ncbi:uncharacterized protein LOC129945198 [Eupeodes corollae]|uniref:uncharacterized protein LOC129945198 n=1 Tax=Eupeodes corollae TaxID=290404 RepID=UPI0024910A23|nr:uncharacterized protein LOC129945198 [Eupeodes corollae]
MFKITIVTFFGVLAVVAAKPGVIPPLAYSAAPLLAGPGIVTATSNQVIARNYNGIATAPLLAAAPFASPLVAAASPIGLASADYTASPLTYAAAYNYAASPFGARYISPFGSLSYAAPAQYLI